MRLLPRQSAPTTPSVPLSDVALSDLKAEMKRRGWEVLPAGAWRDVVGGLESQVAELRRKPDGKRWFDGTMVVGELEHLAGTVLPDAVDRVRELGDENTELRGRAHRAEVEADMLTHQLVGHEIARMETGDDDG